MRTSRTGRPGCKPFEISSAYAALESSSRCWIASGSSSGAIVARQNWLSRGYLSGQNPELHFGLGAFAGKVTVAQIRQIAETKMKDLNANSIEAAMQIILGSAKSCGIEIKG